MGGATALLAVGCSSNLTQEESVQATAQALGAEGLKEELAKLNPVQKYLTVKLENERSLVGKSGNEEARGGGTGYFFYQEKLADGRTLSLMVSSGHGNNQWVEGFCISQPHLENGSARSVKDTAKEKFYVFRLFRYIGYSRFSFICLDYAYPRNVCSALTERIYPASGNQG